MGAYLGLDFGGTKLAVGVADARGRVLGTRRAPTDAAAGPEGALETVARLVSELGPVAQQPEAVGISFGGPVTPDRQRALVSHHGPGWDDFPLVEQVARRWGRPVEMDNDANAAALGEVRFGAGRGYRNVVYLTVSTGIGGGVVIDGELYRGSRGLSGEIGHTIVAPGGPVCPCGKRGCLEAVAAGPMIARAYNERVGGMVVTRAEDVFRRAMEGNALARSVLAFAIDGLGLGIANAINVLDPDLVVLGGGVSNAGDELFVPLRAATQRYAAPSPPGAVPILPAALGDRVGVLGAIALVAE